MALPGPRSPGRCAGSVFLSKMVFLRIVAAVVLAIEGASAQTSSLFFSSLSDTLTVSSIGRGYLHSVVELSDGTVWAFGHNSGGQLGDGSLFDRSVPVPVNISNVKKIVGGSLHTVFLLNDGRVFATGKNQDGQLGDGTNEDRTVPSDTSITDIVDVAAGSTHTIFLHSDGSILAAGSNWAGQLGVTSSSLASSSTPVVVRSASATPAVSSVECGLHHTMLLLTDRTVEAAGWNRDGQLGGGSTWGSFVEAFTSIGFSNVLEVSAGESHTLFRLSDGTVWASGSGSSGQLGDGGTESQKSPVQVDLPESVTAISAGGQHSIFLTSSGAAYACGLASSGQLGLNTTTMQTTPQLIDLAGVTAIAANYRHTLFLSTSTDLPLSSAGQNSEGQLGDGSYQTRTYPIAVWCCQDSWPFNTGSGWTTQTTTSTVTTITVTTTVTTTEPLGDDASDIGAMMGGVLAGFTVCVAGVLIVCGGGVCYFWKRGLKDRLLRFTGKLHKEGHAAVIHPDVEGGNNKAGDKSPVTPAEPGRGKPTLPLGFSATSVATSSVASGKVHPGGFVDGAKTPTADLRTTTQKTLAESFTGTGDVTPDHGRTTATEIRVAAAAGEAEPQSASATASDAVTSPSLSPITPATTTVVVESVREEEEDEEKRQVNDAAASGAGGRLSGSSSDDNSNSNNNNNNSNANANSSSGGQHPGPTRTTAAAAGPSSTVVGAAGLAPAPSARVAAASAAKPGPWRAPGLSLPVSTHHGDGTSAFNEAELPKQSELPPPAGQSAMDLLRGSARATVSTPPFPGVDYHSEPGPKF